MRRRSLIGLLLGVAVGGGVEAQAAPVDYMPESLRDFRLRCLGRARPVELYPRTEAWFSEHWSAAKEPSLYQQSRSPAGRRTTSYRFTWLRSFHAPVFVRVEELPDGHLRMVAKRLSGAGGYEPGVIDGRVDRLLTVAESRRFRRALARANELRLPLLDCRSGFDGAAWIFEANDGGAYRFVQRWSPERGPLRDLGDVLVGFTGWAVGDVY